VVKNKNRISMSAGLIAVSNHKRILKFASGFTLIELIVVIVILGILSAVALPRFIDLGSSARVASINALAGSVKSSLALVNALTIVRGLGTTVPNDPINITWVTQSDGTQIRVWSGYPDRWCDGVGMTLQGAVVPPGGCYLSTAPVPFGNYVFYGYGNAEIPYGDAGWRIENAADPTHCSVAYKYNGTGTPIVTPDTNGCL
jgi:MSHA pilin protein MshA